MVQIKSKFNLPTLVNYLKLKLSINNSPSIHSLLYQMVQVTTSSSTATVLLPTPQVIITME